MNEIVVLDHCVDASVTTILTLTNRKADFAEVGRPAALVRIAEKRSLFAREPPLRLGRVLFYSDPRITNLLSRTQLFLQSAIWLPQRMATGRAISHCDRVIHF